MKDALVFCHRGALGDFILTFPSLLLAKKVLPDLEFVGIGKPEHLKLAKEFGICDSFQNAESAFLLSFFERGELPPLSNKSAKFAILWLKNHAHLLPLLSFQNIKTLLIEPFTQSMHIGKYYFEQVRKFLAPTENFTINDFLFPAVLSVRQEKIALIHPGSGSLSKNFPPEFYIKLAGEIGSEGFSVYFIFGPVEVENLLFKHFPAERSIFPQSCVELKNIISSAYLFIGNDSGPSHLAAFMGIKTITLFKSSDPSLWHPLGLNSIYIDSHIVSPNFFLEEIKKFILT